MCRPHYEQQALHAALKLQLSLHANLCQTVKYIDGPIAATNTTPTCLHILATSCVNTHDDMHAFVSTLCMHAGLHCMGRDPLQDNCLDSSQHAGVRARPGSSAGCCCDMLHLGRCWPAKVTCPCKPVQGRENQNLARLSIPGKGLPGAHTQKRRGMCC